MGLYYTAYAHGCDRHPQSQPTGLLRIEEVTAQWVSYVLVAAWKADKFMEHLQRTRSKSWSCVVGWLPVSSASEGRSNSRMVRLVVDPGNKNRWFNSLQKRWQSCPITFDTYSIQYTCISFGECSIVSDVYACFGYQADWAMIQASDEYWLVWMLIAHSCCLADHTEEPRANGNKSNVLIAERWMF